LPDNIHDHTYIWNLEDLNDFPPVDDCDNLLFIKKTDLNDSTIRLIEENGYIFKHQSVSVWVEKIYKLQDNFPKMWIYTVYEKKVE